MARQNNKNDMVPKHLNPDNITFAIFTEDEIKKLSVLKICSTITFDALGYPVNGGLYDKCLGPLSERGDPCGTCLQNIYQCPGHYGHIELPLPVINPIFIKIIATILKMTCFSCFRIQIPESIKKSLTIQMRLLDKGLLTEAIEIQTRISGAISVDGTFENISAESLNMITEYEKLAMGNIDINCNTALNKNIEGLKNQFLSNMLKEIKMKRLCIYCRQTLNKLNAVKNKYILVSKVVKGESKLVSNESKHLNPEEIRTYLRSLWDNDEELLLQLVPVLSTVDLRYPTDVFFFKVIPVPPPNVRPANFVNGRVTENSQSQIYKAILHDVFLLNVIIKVVQNDGILNVLDEVATGAYTVAKGNGSLEKLHLAWDSLQYNVNNILDKQGRGSSGEQGLKQIIEKKAGIIRMHMMGKRVNYAARSVITPDPNLNIDEIGIPEEFAKKLTYPVPVTSWNVEQLRKIIMNGPNIHPGAVMVEFEDGSITRINPRNQTQQESLLKRLLTPDDGGDGYKGVKMVHRHLCNGDILLLNRQPTLHRPSIMAHTARILKGEKTLRLHYANCKAYNADFDGDEMNAHFPQNELARSEGYILANVCNQYLVPKDGTPLSGLIQDHMISGVRLTVRGKFFNKYDYQQLVFQALSYKTSDIKLLPPAIIKPRMLWSGKQILSTVFLNVIPEGSVPINLTSTSKISAKSWQTRPTGKWIYGGTKLDGDDMTEAQVIIRHGELLVGVLDKTHYGATPYGLVHCMYELYGGTYATRLLSSLAKLFTCFLQREGFTLGVRDILVTEGANIERKKVIEESRKVGKWTMIQALGLSGDVTLNEIVNKVDEVGALDPKLRSVIDRQYKTSLDSFTNDINKACLPAGLLCKFPENNLQLMVQSGAKGSTVNTMQISCLLGQIELEGKRPPVMISGKSLPSFPVFEFAPRAGGYIDGRFMTGIQPQEFFFHCMAGREGLIDTAVKTSRSGYLQRCLIKHLEGITIGYDLTVRDSDRSVIQFYYGEDGMDISKSQFLNSKQLKFLFENAKAILDKDMIKKLKCVDDHDSMDEYDAKIKSWKSKYGHPFAKDRRTAFTIFSEVASSKLNIDNGDKISETSGRSKKTKTILKLWNKAGDDIKDRYKEQCVRCPDPINSIYQPDCYFGSLNERLTELMQNSIKQHAKKKERRRFEDMLKLKSMQGICAPGEPVGLLAAQSIGEPSTQMTLNTFHFAGRGEMNVTLGIPRLREILMMASKSIKTPSMEIPFLDVPNLEKKAEKLRKTLTRVVVANVLEKIDVTTILDTTPVRQQRYMLRFHFLPHHLYKDDYVVKPKYILKHMTKKYFSQMFYAIKRLAKANSTIVSIEEEKKSSRFRSSNDEDEDEEGGEANVSKTGMEMDSSDEEVDDPEDAKSTRKYQEVHEGQEAQDEEDKDVERDISDEENEEGEKMKVEGHIKNDNIEATQNAVVDSYEYVKNYSYDSKDHLWCELTFALPLLFKKIDVTAVLKETAAKSIVWETPNIKRAITYMKDDVLTLRTDGINIVEMFKYNELLDLNRLYSNDIHKVAENYGIEAGARVIVKEVQDVFKVYGITVDPRHLLLIADYMTYNGTFEPLSRKGMENSASPLQQMSFESSLTFLKNATLKGKQDQLQNPSSCLMVGKPCTTGTGAFTLLQKFPVLSASN